MSKLVCRMAKVKKNDIRGYQIHNLRELKSNTNPDIDSTRSHLNKDFINSQPINFKKKWEQRIEEGYTLKRAIRGDATRYNEFIIGSDKEFFDKLDQSEKDRFFQTATDFFTERYGKENVLYSIAHYDELRGAGAHAHIAVVPLKDGKLTGKEVFNRNELRYLQEELPKALQRAGFDIDRGREGSKAKHIDTATFKMMKSQEAERLAKQDLEYTKQHVDLFNEEIESKTAALEKIEEIESVEYQQKRTWYGKKTDQVVVDQEDFEQLKQLAEDHAKLKIELDSAQRDNSVLVRKYDDLEEIKDRYADKNHELGLELHNYKTDVERIIEQNISVERKRLFDETKKEVDKNRHLVSMLERSVTSKDEQISGLQEVVSIMDDEIRLKDRQIDKLKTELENLKNAFKNYKIRMSDHIEKVVKEVVKVTRYAMMRSNNEWIKKNINDNMSSLHSSDKKLIEYRAQEIELEYAEKEQRKLNSKNNELER